MDHIVGLYRKKSFYCKNLGNVPKTGISEFIENVVVDTNAEKLVGSEEGTEWTNWVGLNWVVRVVTCKLKLLLFVSYVSI